MKEEIEDDTNNFGRQEVTNSLQLKGLNTMINCFY
jgi:hypothetical protein